jgi:hypothetical protein
MKTVKITKQQYDTLLDSISNEEPQGKKTYIFKPEQIKTLIKAIGCELNEVSASHMINYETKKTTDKVKQIDPKITESEDGQNDFIKFSEEIIDTLKNDDSGRENLYLSQLGLNKEDLINILKTLGALIITTNKGQKSLKIIKDKFRKTLNKLYSNWVNKQEYDINEETSTMSVGGDSGTFAYDSPHFFAPARKYGENDKIFKDGNLVEFSDCVKYNNKRPKSGDCLEGAASGVVKLK